MIAARRSWIAWIAASLFAAACAQEPSTAEVDAPPGSSSTSTTPPVSDARMPVGIPAPDFGLDIRAGSATVIASSSQRLPRTIVAGAVVEIQGTYSGSESVSCEGTAQAPAFIRGASGARMTGSLEIRGTYCIVENLSFTGGAEVSIYDATHVVLRDSNIRGTLDQSRTAGVGIASSSDVLVRGVSISDIGDWQATFDQDANGIAIGLDCTRIWILDNTISYVSGDGVTINPYPYIASNARSTHHVYVGRNISHHNKQTGFWTKMSSDIIFSENTAYGMRPSDSHYGAGFGYQYGTDRIWFLFNRSYDSTTGFGISGDLENGADGRDSYFIGNVIYDLPNLGGDAGSPWFENSCFLLQGGIRRHLVNNTCYEAPAGVRAPPRGEFVLLANNIFAGIRPTNAQVIIEGVSSKLETNLTDDAARFVGADSCSGCVAGNPGFVNTASGDFSLGAGSAAINRGTDESVYATFQSLYQMDIRRDAVGRPRPQGGAWDIGAYERP